MIELPEMPPSVAALLRDDRGYPIPFFNYVGRDGVPDFRVARSGAIAECVRGNLCWVCGEQLFSSDLTFVIGPMCVVNLVTSEPPCHLDCARFAAKACPFLSKPKMKRLPESPGSIPPAGFGIERNPGVTALYVCDRYKIVQVKNGILFELPPKPWRVEWFAEGREATRDEILESMDSGLPLLRDKCENGDDHQALTGRYLAALQYLPAEAAGVAP